MKSIKSYQNKARALLDMSMLRWSLKLMVDGSLIIQHNQGIARCMIGVII